MILDSTLAFDGPAFTAITVTRDSTNNLDMGVARAMGPGTPLAVIIIGNGLFAAAGAATLSIAFRGSVDNATYTTYAQGTVLTIAQLNAGGYFLPIRVPSQLATGAMALPRYYQLTYTVATGPFTAGAVMAYLALDRDRSIAYPAGYSTTYV